MWDSIFYLVGFVVTIGAMCAAMIFLGVALAFLIMRYAPRVSYGKPKNLMQVSVIGHKEPSPTIESPTVIRTMSIRWLAGLSWRPRPAWFIGIIRWSEVE
jgi:hypothetical protein